MYTPGNCLVRPDQPGNSHASLNTVGQAWMSLTHCFT